jgi:ligand-binding sensor domain-containing protein
MYKIILFLVSLLLSSQLNSQELKFDQFGTEEGLPHYYTEYVFEDSKGFLWIGTIGGLVKYDGVEMETFTTEEGLLSNNIITITEDPRGNIWIGTDNGLSRIGDSIKSYPLGENGQVTKKILVTSKNKILAANLSGTFVYHELLDSFLPHPIMGEFYTRTLIEDDNQDIWFGGIDGLYKSFQDTVVQVVIPGQHKNYHNSIVSSWKDFNGNLWFGTGSGFAKYENSEMKVFDQELGVEHVYIKLFQLQDSTFIFGTYGGGIVTFKNPEEFHRQYLSQDAITQNTVHGIEQTRGGAIWLATGNKLHKTKREVFEKIELSFDEQSVSTYEIVQNYKGELWMATNNGILVCNTQGKEQRLLQVSKDPQENNVISLYADNADSSIYVGTYSGICFKYKNGKFSPYGNEDQMVRGQAIYGVYKDSESNIWISKNVRVLKIHNDSVKEVFLDSIHSMVFEVVEDKQNYLWFATSKGLFCSKNDQIEHITSIDESFLGQIRQIEIDKDGGVWIGSNSQGVFRYDPELKEGKHYSIKDGLSSNFIQSLKYDKHRECIWAGTINGVTQIKLNNRSFPEEFRTIDASDFSGCNINSLFCDSLNGVFVGSENSLFHYKTIRDTKNSNVPIVKLKNIEIFNDVFDFAPFCQRFDEFSLPQGLILPYDKNHLTFRYYGIEFNEPESVLFKVKLDGFDKEWSVFTKDRFVTYNNLSPGNYQLKIKAKNSEGFWSEEFTFAFVIDPPFYLKSWFVILSSLFLLLVLFLIIKKRDEKIKSKFLIERNIAQLELKALQAQMNPHFIFNIMNNIQNLIVTEQHEKAIKLLGDFATLIRTVLDISSEKLIDLTKEIQFLTTYIELDLTQYPEKYTYEFNVDEKLDPESILIPPMLLQPFIENSILHGLMHKDGFGNLTITISAQSKTLLCIIEDNGIGRRKSKELGSTNHSFQSKSLNISNERIGQFNKMDKLNSYKIEIIDLYDNKKNSLGTKVVLELPLQQKY